MVSASHQNLGPSESSRNAGHAESQISSVPEEKLKLLRVLGAIFQNDICVGYVHVGLDSLPIVVIENVGWQKLEEILNEEIQANKSIISANRKEVSLRTIEGIAYAVKTASRGVLLLKEKND